MASPAPRVLLHHEQRKVCASRPRYREGRRPRAVKVYTINQESRYLLVQGVPAIGVMKELVEQFALYGAIQEYNILHEYPAEEFTEVYLIKFQRLQSARVAKRKLDERSFFGGLLHICYAPEYESVQETREKLQERRRYVARVTSSKDADVAEKPQEAPSTSTVKSLPAKATSTTPSSMPPLPPHSLPPSATPDYRQGRAPPENLNYRQGYALPQPVNPDYRLNPALPPVVNPDYRLNPALPPSVNPDYRQNPALPPVVNPDYRQNPALPPVVNPDYRLNPALPPSVNPHYREELAFPPGQNTDYGQDDLLPPSVNPAYRQGYALPPSVNPDYMQNNAPPPSASPNYRQGSAPSVNPDYIENHALPPPVYPDYMNKHAPPSSIYPGYREKPALPPFANPNCGHETHTPLYTPSPDLKTTPSSHPGIKRTGDPAPGRAAFSGPSTARFMPRTTQLQERQRRREENTRALSLPESPEIVIGPKLPEAPKLDMEDDSLNVTANQIRGKLKEVAASSSAPPAGDSQPPPPAKQRRRI